MEVPCEQIRIGERYRREMGDLEGLAESIAREGLLQPIGLTEDYRLVFGQRRLLAVRDILRWLTIPARVVRVSSLLAAEHDENEFSKSFTASERAAIGKALEAELGERRGRHNPDNCPEFHGTETRELAAQKAGFDSYKTYERAKKVIEQGAPELVAAMDAGEISISAAAVIAQEPPEEQRKMVELPAELRRQIVRQLREATELPSTAEARRIARETGMLVADRTGRYRSGATAEERAAAKEDLDAIWAATRAVLALADTPLDPVELASRLEYWHCPGIRAKAPVALDWLHRFEEAIRENKQVS
ncbi:MAG: ParB/RepB/Spo0J family partition protein [Bryobacteraceae bacterium]